MSASLDFPDRFYDPITNRLMTNPVSVDGFTFDKSTVDAQTRNNGVIYFEDRLLDASRESCNTILAKEIRERGLRIGTGTSNELSRSISRSRSRPRPSQSRSRSKSGKEWSREHNGEEEEGKTRLSRERKRSMKEEKEEEEAVGKTRL